jgi:hypothetical protein
MRKILIITAFIVELFSIARWSNCWLFKDIFYYTPSMITARAITAISEDKSRAIPGIVTHLMHNKAIYFVWGGVQTLLQYWDIRFLKGFIGIIGAIGAILALWYLFTKFKKNIYLWFLFIFCLIISAVEMFLQPNIIYDWKLVVFGSGFELFSLIGLWQFLKTKNKKRYSFIIFLLIVSVLYLIFFPLSYQSFCLKV